MPSIAFPTTIETIVTQIDEISSFPDIALRVMRVVSRNDASIADLRAVVEQDPQLVARVLRTVNSAAYGLRCRVDSIHRAIALLGFTTIKNLALTASVSPVFQDTTPIGSYNRGLLWKHLVSVAVISRMVAARSGLKYFEEAYMCGLLHDLGIILLDQHHHEVFVSVLHRLNPQAGTCEIEREILGFTHAQLGAAVAERWGFPESIVDVIRYHHDSRRCQPEYRSIGHAVEIANYLCTRRGLPSLGVQNISIPHRDAFSALSLGREGMRVLVEDLEKELHKSQDLFRI